MEKVNKGGKSSILENIKSYYIFPYIFSYLNEERQMVLVDFFYLSRNIQEKLEKNKINDENTFSNDLQNNLQQFNELYRLYNSFFRDEYKTFYQILAKTYKIYLQKLKKCYTENKENKLNSTFYYLKESINLRKFINKKRIYLYIICKFLETIPYIQISITNSFERGLLTYLNINKPNRIIDISLSYLDNDNISIKDAVFKKLILSYGQNIYNIFENLSKLGNLKFEKKVMHLCGKYENKISHRDCMMQHFNEFIIKDYCDLTANHDLNIHLYFKDSDNFYISNEFSKLKITLDYLGKFCIIKRILIFDKIDNSFDKEKTSKKLYNYFSERKNPNSEVSILEHFQFSSAHFIGGCKGREIFLKFFINNDIINNYNDGIKFIDITKDEYELFLDSINKEKIHVKKYFFNDTKVVLYQQKICGVINKIIMKNICKHNNNRKNDINNNDVLKTGYNINLSDFSEKFQYFFYVEYDFEGYLSQIETKEIIDCLKNKNLKAGRIKNSVICFSNGLLQLYINDNGKFLLSYDYDNNEDQSSFKNLFSIFLTPNKEINNKLLFYKPYEYFINKKKQQ